MTDTLFASIITSGTLTGPAFLLCTACSLVIGLFVGLAYTRQNACSKSFFMTLVLLPAIVQMVIMLVNGNIGAGVAVAGAFSLVRFRSVPGKGQEITSIFLAMAAGLATGMGYVGIAILFTVVLSGISLFLQKVRFGEGTGDQRSLRITVPENLDFEGKFEDVFQKYLRSYEIEEVRTTNMGSLYRLSLRVVLKPSASTKALLDELRMRNGNLDIILGRVTDNTEAL